MLVLVIFWKESPRVSVSLSLCLSQSFSLTHTTTHGGSKKQTTLKMKGICHLGWELEEVM